MNTFDTFQSTQKQHTNATEVNWKEVYKVLPPLTKHIVYTYRVPAWSGQENDVAEDIMQEVARKLFEYEQKIARGGVLSIHSPLSMVKVIAYNSVKDMRRRDMRITHIEVQDEDVEQLGIPDDVVDAAECAAENAYYEMLFTEMAQEITRFPHKQRQALLTDLAAHMNFELQPTPLQKAFLKVGISLQEYQRLLPTTAEERNRHVSLLAHAYKRVSSLKCVQLYVSHESEDLC
jgi:DNA-directed RNA polymerase specialized sigma24 family protein